VRIGLSVVAMLWIPSEAMGGMTRLPFEMGVAHYDVPRLRSSTTSTP
jgi:hypothetical protein